MKFTYAPESKPLDGYTIKRAVHRGHFGEVYYALSDAGKEVALKLLRQDVDVELRGVTQCLNLKHPNLVTIFDIRQDGDGDYWIVMEYVSGQRLDQVIEEFPHGMPMEKVLAWLNGLTDGLTYMHNSGVVHRDLKPANLFWDHGHVKIGDVGLSKIISPSRKSAQTQSVGTVYYMAPEVSHGRYGRTVDVYSLGVILVEMLTGQLPFEGETVAEILFKHLTGAPDLSRVPVPVQSVLARALEKDPEKRIASVEQLRDEFMHAVKTGKGTPVTVSPTISMTQAPAWQASVRQQPEPAPQRTGDSHFDSRILVFLGVILSLLMFPILPRMMGASASARPSWFMIFLLCGIGYVLWRQYPYYFSPRWRERDRDGDVPRPPVATHQPVIDELEVVPDPVRRPFPHAARRMNFTTSTGAPARVVQPLSHRVQQYAWEMVLSVISTLVLTAGLAVVSSQFGVNVPFHRATQASPGERIMLSSEWDHGMVGLFAVVTILAVWGILLPVRIGEWRNWDGSTCRLVSGAIGVAVGTAAYLLDRWLLIPLNLPEGGHFGMIGIFDHLGRQPLLDVQREPTWFGYSLFFFLLFILVRWWKQAAGDRTKRFRTFAVFTTAFMSFWIAVFWAFPMNWALTWAAVISSVVQLSAMSVGQPTPLHPKKK
ncbi:MAG: serine/threonine protein kinase [Planctomycetaceae bacterium]